jgi:hypothetical protein
MALGAAQQRGLASRQATFAPLTINAALEP